MLGDSVVLSRAKLEHGQALVFAIVTMAVLTGATATGLYYASASEHASSYSKASDTAYRLAETGLNNAAEILGNPSNNAMLQSTLPSGSSTATAQAYPGGTSKWWGVFNGTNAWTVYGLGVVTSPVGASFVTRQVSATIPVQPSLTQPVNNQIWNYLYATGTGATCDESFSNSVAIQASLYVQGNLCTANSASVMPATGPPNPPPAVNLFVQGTYTSSGTSHLGTSTSPINQAIIVGGCNGHSPCKFNGAGDPVYATATGSGISNPFVAPTPQFDYWYQNATVGPKAPCTTKSGTPPVFENETTNPTRNNSVPSTFNLTPSSSYTCSTSTGQISWNASTDVLSVTGVIYIDGSATSTASLASYSGEGTLYLSGTFVLAGSAQLCGGVKNGSCDFGSWNPNTDMLIVCAANMGNQTPAISFLQSSHFQGGVYTTPTSAISVSQSGTFEGPMIGGSLQLNNSVTAYPFPTITTIPLGAPGNPNTYAQPQSPSSYSG